MIVLEVKEDMVQVDTNMNVQLLQEMQESIDRVNRIMGDEELSKEAKRILVAIEKDKQHRLKLTRQQWNRT